MHHKGQGVQTTLRYPLTGRIDDIPFFIKY